MAFARAAGVLLHPTSLPGRYGIGDLGEAAFEYVEFLAVAGQRLWQTLPLGPTGYGDSPYQCLSAFAGNPLLISLDALVADGLIPPEVARQQEMPQGPVDFASVIESRRALWPDVLERFDAAAAPAIKAQFETFCRAQARWLDDAALFLAVKEAHHQTAWTAWSRDIARREPDAMRRWQKECARDIRLHKLTQFLFFEQWQRLRAACRRRSVAFIGDLPIFVAHDSADVWAHPDLFQLDPEGRPAVVAGVPPDYFSATGQLWGNPHYRWEMLRHTGYAWWIERFRMLFSLVERVRIDHFRGFDAAWAVPAGATSAMDGRWVPGPGAALFDVVERELGRGLPVIAENLGVITPEVEALRERFGFPGMAILQFAFGRDPQAPAFRPHNYVRNLVAYTGTHDNDTAAGWWAGDADHSTRSPAEILQEREHAARYLDVPAEGDSVHWAFVRAVLASVADTAIVPAQDLLGLGADARMNRPGTAAGNWRWRLLPRQLSAEVARTLWRMTDAYERL